MGPELDLISEWLIKVPLTAAYEGWNPDPPWAVRTSCSVIMETERTSFIQPPGLCASTGLGSCIYGHFSLHDIHVVLRSAQLTCNE